jgi:GntR family transcriptional regulator of gluconate operon
MSATSSHWSAAVPAVLPAPALGVHVLTSLRRLIITGQIAPGTHLVEAQVSKSFAVSRGPVRDALRQLEAEGLVESRRRGVFVIGLTADDIEELYSLRQVIEREAVVRCVQADTDLDWSPARDALAAMTTTGVRGDVLAFAEADLDFHSAFYTLSGHRRLESIWQQYRPTFADMLSVTNTMDRDLDPIVRDHADLLQAVVERRLEDSLTRLHVHIEGSRRRMLTAYALSGSPTTN